MKIIVLYNLPGTSTSENIKEADDDTFNSANDVCNILNSLGHNASLLGISQKDIESLKDIKCDLVFNLIEWSGRETDDAVRAIGILEENKIAFTGCGSLGYRISSEKEMMKMLMVENNIPTPVYRIIAKDQTDFDLENISFPVILKPAGEHCAIGIDQTSVVNGLNDLKIKVEDLKHKYEQPIIVEEFIDGLEAHVTVLEKNGKPWVLPPAVFKFKKQNGYVPIITYDYKWNENSKEADMCEWVEEIDDELLSEIEKVAINTFDVLKGRTHSRIDMRIKGNEVFVLEINNNPGIGWDEDSGLGYSCKKIGFSHQDLIKHMVDSAI